jgi:HK97 family phage portal protein
MFLTSAQLKAAPGPTDDFWYQPVRHATASGVSVGPAAAMSASVVYRCVNLLASTIAKLPLKLRERDTSAPVDEHPVARVLGRRPNRWQTSYQWRAMQMTHLLLRGNAYSEMVFGPAGEIQELISIHPDAVLIEELPSGDWRYKVKLANGAARTLNRAQVLHLVGHCESLPYGISPITAQRESIGAALAAQRYAARVFKNDARPGGGYIEMPGKFQDAETRRRWVEEYHRGMTGENAHRTPVFEQGMKYHAVGMSNADAQMIESRRYSDTDLCRIFGVPPHKIGNLDRATFSNMEQQNVEFYEEVHSWAANLEQQLQMQMLTEIEEDRFYLQFELKGVLRADSSARSAFYTQAITSGWMTRNEVREREDMEPIDGLDEPLAPLNMAPAGESSEPTPPNAPRRDREDSDEDNGDDPNARRLDVLLQASARRAVTREVRGVGRLLETGASDAKLADFYRAHAEFVAEAMAWPTGQARAWCDARAAQLLAEPSADRAALLARWETDGSAGLWGL